MRQSLPLRKCCFFLFGKMWAKKTTPRVAIHNRQLFASLLSGCWIWSLMVYVSGPWRKGCMHKIVRKSCKWAKITLYSCYLFDVQNKREKVVRGQKAVCCVFPIAVPALCFCTFLRTREKEQQKQQLESGNQVNIMRNVQKAKGIKQHRGPIINLCSRSAKSHGAHMSTVCLTVTARFVCNQAREKKMTA